MDLSRGRRSLIPWLFPAAMVPMFAANGALIYFALQSKPALVDERPFEDGRTYNRALAAAAAQDRLGWRADLESSPSDSIALAITDRQGAPVTGLSVQLRVWRPVGALPDVNIALAEIAPGSYRGALKLPSAGQWQFDFVARRGSDEFAYGRRIIAP